MGKPGYEGYLNERVTTLPKLLRDAGYHTYMAGKWHMGKAPNLIPAARGFERDFSLLDGAGSYWDMTNFTASTPMSTYTEDGRYLKSLPRDYYATKTYTDKMISFIEANRGDGKPFFAYLSIKPLMTHTICLRTGEVGTSASMTRVGRSASRAARSSNRDGHRSPGNDARRTYVVRARSDIAGARVASSAGMKMELYAGMVENLDYHIGRFVAYLKEIGEYENTIFIVFGDNGAEGSDLFASIAGTPGTRDYLFAAVHWSQTHPKAWGDPGSYVAYGPCGPRFP